MNLLRHARVGLCIGLRSQNSSRPSILQRGAASSSTRVPLPAALTKDYVVLTDDGSTFVCWHPEQKFPYECSRPLPEVPAAKESVLNVEQSEAVQVFRQKSDEVVRQELMKLTYTTKHRWFPRSRDKFAKKTPPDREYL